MIRYNEKWMNKTFDMACEAAPVFRVRICATLVYNNSPIISRLNTFKTHPFQKKYAHHEDAIHLHAETHCVISSIRSGFDVNKLKYCSLYVARATYENKKFSYGDVKPCVGCQMCLSDFGIKFVYYTTKTGVHSL